MLSTPCSSQWLPCLTGLLLGYIILAIVGTMDMHMDNNWLWRGLGQCRRQRRLWTSSHNYNFSLAYLFFCDLIAWFDDNNRRFDFLMACFRCCLVI